MNDINLIKDFFKNNLKNVYFIEGHFFIIESLNDEFVRFQLHSSDVIDDDDLNIDNVYLFYDDTVIYYYDDFLNTRLEDLTLKNEIIYNCNKIKIKIDD